MRRLRTGLVKSVTAFCVGQTFVSVVGYPARVNGESMEPTLIGHIRPRPSDLDPLGGGVSWLARLREAVESSPDWVFVNAWPLRQKRCEGLDIRRGDIVVFVSPKDPSDHVIKRVTALENEVVRVFAPDYEGAEPIEARTVQIPAGHCWVEGDNPKRSVDSRKYGPIPMALIFAKANRIVFPPGRLGPIQPRSGEAFSDALKPPLSQLDNP